MKMLCKSKMGVFILVILLITFGIQGANYAQVGNPTITASTRQPLTETTLNESVVTLTLSGSTYERWLRKEHANAFKVSGIAGVTLKSVFDSFNPFFDVTRVNNIVVRVKLDFSGSMDTDATLTFTVGADAIANYNGPALTAEILVREGDPFHIQGPYLWMITDGSAINRDYLTRETGGAMTEAQVAQNGVSEGDTIDRFQWTSGDIVNNPTACERFCEGGLFGGCKTLCWSNNINNTLNILGFGTGGNMTGRTAYALITLISPRDQEDVTLSVPSSDAVKVWLNGEVVHTEAATALGCRTVDVPFAFDPTVCTPDSFSPKVNLIPATLKAGNNLLLVKVSQHGQYWGMGPVRLNADFTTAIPKAKTTTNLPPTRTQEIPVTTTTVSILPAPVRSPAVGERLTLSLNIAKGEDVAGYEATVQFDTTALRYVSSANGDYLSADAFFVPPVLDGNHVKLAATSLAGESNGNGTLATLTFEVVAVKASTLTLSDALLSNREGESSRPHVEGAEITKSPQLRGDVNADGTVNIQDLVLVGSSLGKTGENAADVNGDGVINIADLVLVAGVLGNTAAAPSLHLHSLEMFTSSDVRQWLSQAQHLNLTDPTAQRGVLFLDQLLMALIPKETALLANYPNPFNPETWIPYQLAKPANVKLTIYAIDGQMVRQLSLGHQPAGIYQYRSRAAYWDGRNAFGEPVASGVYFYVLTAGDFSATRKMLIRK